MSELASSHRGKRERLRILYGRWLPLAFAIATVANIVLTFFLPGPSLPIRLHDDGSLTHLAHTEQPSVNRRFAFYLELDDATDGGVLVVAVDSFVDPDLAGGFADFDVIECEFDPGPIAEEIAGQDPLGDVETENGNLPYFIIAGQGDLWWVAITDEGVVVVPESVAPPPCVGP